MRQLKMAEREIKNGQLEEYFGPSGVMHVRKVNCGENPSECGYSRLISEMCPWLPSAYECRQDERETLDLNKPVECGSEKVSSET